MLVRRLNLGRVDHAEIAGVDARRQHRLREGRLDILGSNGAAVDGSDVLELESGRSLSVQVTASGDSALAARSGSTSRLLPTFGSHPVLKR